MGLRDDKKRKVRLAIERTILALVLERGVEDVTVEEVCAQAEVSKKTFFNYFPSKMAAILGNSVPFPSSEELLATLEAHPEASYLDMLVELLGSRLGAEGDAEVAALRCEVFKTMPELFFQGQREMHEIHRRMADAVRDLLVAHPERRLMSELAPAREGFAASSVASGIARMRSMMALEEGREVGASEARRMVGELMADWPRA